MYAGIFRNQFWICSYYKRPMLKFSKVRISINIFSKFDANLKPPSDLIPIFNRDIICSSNVYTYLLESCLDVNGSESSIGIIEWSNRGARPTTKKSNKQTFDYGSKKVKSKIQSGHVLLQCWDFYCDFVCCLLDFQCCLFKCAYFMILICVVRK